MPRRGNDKEGGGTVYEFKKVDRKLYEQSKTLEEREMAARDELKKLEAEYLDIFITANNLLKKGKENANLQEIKERNYRVYRILCDLLVDYFGIQRKGNTWFCLFYFGEEAEQDLNSETEKAEALKD